MGEPRNGVTAHLHSEGAGARGAREDVGRGAFVGHPSCLEKQHAVRPCRGSLKVVDDGQDRDAASADPVQDAEELELMTDVQMGPGLVEKQHSGLLGQAAGEGGKLPFSSRQGFESSARKSAGARLLESALHRATVVAREGAEGASVRIAAEGDPFAYRQGARAVIVRRDDGQGPGKGVSRPGREGSAVEGYVAGLVSEEARQGSDEGGLAGGIRSDKRHRFSPMEREAGAVEDAVAPPRDHEIAGLQERGHPRPSLARRASRKYGAPTKAVRDPNGRSRLWLRVRAPRSATTTTRAPARNAAGSR